MTGRTHDAIAFASLITIATLNPPESLNLATASAAVVVNIVGGTLPDIDQASNRLWDLLPFGERLAKVFKKIFMGHRTLTHSFLGMFIFINIFWFAIPKLFNPEFINGEIIFTSLVIGYISHIVADATTRDGLPLFFPLKIKIGFPPLKFLRIKAGGWVENLIILPGTAGYIFWFIGKNQEDFLTLIYSLK